MSVDTNDRCAQDRARVSGEQEYVVRYFADIAARPLAACADPPNLSNNCNWAGRRPTAVAANRRRAATISIPQRLHLFILMVGVDTPAFEAGESYDCNRAGCADALRNLHAEEH